eukprot:scaffold7542_cov113-Cylindrotheca_fusiformis.AAC.9
MYQQWKGRSASVAPFGVVLRVDGKVCRRAEVALPTRDIRLLQLVAPSVAFGSMSSKITTMTLEGVQHPVPTTLRATDSNTSLESSDNLNPRVCKRPSKIESISISSGKL